MRTRIILYGIFFNSLQTYLNSSERNVVSTADYFQNRIFIMAVAVNYCGYVANNYCGIQI